VFGIFGIYFTVDAVLKSVTTNEKDLALGTLFSEGRSQLLLDCVNACLQENAFTSTAVTKAKGVLNNYSPKTIQSIESNLQSNPMNVNNGEMTKLMCHDAIQNLFGANAEMAYEQNRWILGRAEKNSGPGQKLVVNVGAFNRPSSY
jgi:hypothetical protein